MEDDKPKPVRARTGKPDMLARAAAILEAELVASHEAVQQCVRHVDYMQVAARLMTAAAALAGALAKIRGETRQRITVERLGERSAKADDSPRGGTPKNRKTNSAP